ncbi:MAG: bifunctional phosphoribosylaminoimidazolecarboxamide formyltransferase/IMP cyclohydrolase [Planctomycetes bacterium]|nr:bifunctional phosphoribosylaminoimidazolecarboxamide formyltransferase/IMP cyclohydrolase [Planctomycetota bacterium]
MKRALLSVTDKTGIVDFAKGLVRAGYSILSTGGTRRALTDAGVEATEVADYTGFPEMMDGRIKTLHPRVHGGLLARRDLVAHGEAMRTHGIDPIDLLCVNLYRFREATQRPDAARDDIVENIDIGGPAMLRSAAKNHASVTVVVDPADYAAVLAALPGGDEAAGRALRRRLAAKAFAHTAAYDAAIAQWFDAERRELPDEPYFAPRAAFAGELLQTLRYGENPHQRAAFYSAGGAGPSLAGATQLAGKELSYNNILDADAALACALDFDPGAFACVLVKHNNPCGVAVAPTLTRAFELALASDPVSAFGGILATNRTFDAATAAAVVASGTFLEVVVAPSIEPGALAELEKAKWGASVRVLDLGGSPTAAARCEPVFRPVSGGFLLQTPDQPDGPPEQRVACARAPTAVESATLAFAWQVGKHVKSNAIVLARATDDGAHCTVGVGAGQMSRVDAAKIAVDKAGDRARGTVVASDAFFPFPDGLQVCAAAGATAAIQPGGSKRDDEVVAVANEHGMAMVMTGRRHFRH